METHLSSPYQNYAHVPMWTGLWINQKYATRLCLQVSKSYDESITIHIFCISTENNQSNGTSMLAVFLKLFLHNLNFSSFCTRIINRCLLWRWGKKPISASMLYLKSWMYFANLVNRIKRKKWEKMIFHTA